jgi:cell division control protein 7
MQFPLIYEQLKLTVVVGRTFATNVPDLLQQEGITWQEFVEKLNPDIATPRKYDMRFYPHNCKHRDGIKSSSSMPPSAPPTSSPPPPTSDSTSNPFSAADDVTSTISERYLNPPSLERHTRDMLNAFDLLEAVLHFESIKRIIPRDVLYHPFLSEPGIDPETEGDDEFVPHMPGTGVCRKFHHVDRIVDEMYVEVWRKPEEVMSLDVEGSDEELDEEKEKGVLIEKDGQTWVQDFVFCMPGQGIAIGNKPCEFHRDPWYIFD